MAKVVRKVDYLFVNVYMCCYKNEAIVKLSVFLVILVHVRMLTKN